MRRLNRSLSIVTLLPLLLGSLFAAPAPVAAQTPNCRSVMEAIAAGEATLVLTANANIFYDQPLDYSLSNLSANALDVCFPAGLTMISGDGQYQNLVLTRTIDVSVPVNGSSSGTLFADCINLERHAPSSGGSFSPGGMADGALLRVAQAIDARSDQGTLGAQMAIWAVTDGFTLEGGTGATGENASMIELLAPILCLDSKDIDEGQAILTQANAGVSLYSNETQGLEFVLRQPRIAYEPWRAGGSSGEDRRRLDTGAMLRRAALSRAPRRVYRRHYLARATPEIAPPGPGLVQNSPSGIIRPDPKLEKAQGMIDVNDLRKGVTFELDGRLYKVLEYSHNKPGRGNATIRVKTRDLRTGNQLEKTFQSGDRVQDIRLDHHQASYLYTDGNFYHFMDTESLRPARHPHGDHRRKRSLSSRKARR